MSELVLCGMALDELGEINPVFANLEGRSKELVYFGIGSANRVLGLPDIVIQPITKWCREGLSGITLSEEYLRLQELLETQVRGCCQIVIKIEGGYLLVEDLEWDVIMQQPERLGDGKTVEYKGMRDVSCLDEDEPIYYDLVRCVQDM